MADAAPSNEQLLAELQTVASAVNDGWLVICGALVFSMQLGFAALSAGSISSKNARNILLKNLMDASAGALAFWALGFAFAYGDSPYACDAAEGGCSYNPFIGKRYFFLAGFDQEQGNGETYAFWFFQFSFAATAATIVSGSVAERCRFGAYLAYSFYLTAFVYPVVAHWVWSRHGWASAFNAENPLFNSGVIDFAGAGVVHMTGGLSGLLGAFFVGPRLGRFYRDEDGKPQVKQKPGHSSALATIGVFMLWFGWFGFNPGSTLGLVSVDGEGGSNFALIAGRCAANTTISAAAGAFSALITTRVLSHAGTWDIGCALNGALAGLVSITSACATAEPYASLVIGLIGGWVYLASSWLLLRLRIDDPLEASPVHFFCGAWGVLAAGLFSTRDNLMRAYGRPQGHSSNFGLLYGGGWDLFAAQLVFIVVLTGWVTVLMGTFFFICYRLDVLRVSEKVETEGLDISHHGGSAYPEGMMESSTTPKTPRTPSRATALGL